MLIHAERGRGWCYWEMREHCSQLEHVDTCEKRYRFVLFGNEGTLFSARAYYVDQFYTIKSTRMGSIDEGHCKYQHH